MMVAYVATDGGHSAAHWCSDCGALGWRTYAGKGSDGPTRWTVPRARRL